MPDIVRRPEFVVIPETTGKEDLIHVFREHGLDAYVYRYPMGIKPPEAWAQRPAEAISVGGSVSVEFAVPALILAHQVCPELKYVHLASDSKDHFTTPESVDYEIVINFLTEVVQPYKCKPWAAADFERLKEITRHSDFHYYVRSFYDKSGMFMRDDDSTIIKYIGGIHDGETCRMHGRAEAIAKLGLLGRMHRQDGSSFDVYDARINGRVLEYHFVRTERKGS